MIDVEKPVWLLDVDGVINTTRPGWGGSPQRSLVWSGADNTSYLMRWAPGLIDRIRALVLEDKVEIRWCTTWCLEADRLERLWSLPAFARTLDNDPMPRGPDCWPLKLAAAWSVLAEGRRLIWTDDEALPPPGSDRDELTVDGRALLIAPRSNRGLQPEDLDLIAKFAEGRRLPTRRVAGRHRGD
ncbi:hypothetical protein [Actinoplanes friuliensis]|uniref:Uncharacterized protein n=1 Tax=Actinoplanes friuliensis DSM 7358 TaxID=1246995 RepID=U5W2G6_9ACTN|nr:hypothetical protein [Actinoplanes friuliensis]AGZ43428.1 hypothetical protein AFR_25820 [Actinoplanes friuliensis DSM 7358]